MSSHTSAHAAGSLGRRGRAVRAVAHSALVGLVAGGATMATVQVAQAVAPVPTFPDNITVFPQRDFVSIEGYQAPGQVDQTAKVVVTRGGVTTSTATGTIAAGDPALEVNHPGGVCWQGVTPNIKPGDVVTLSIGGAEVGAVTTLTPEVTGVTKVGDADLVIRGIRAKDVPASQIEQRIVAPALRDTAVARRDVRAPARPSTAYSSTLSFPSATTFSARYHFNDRAGTVVNEGTQMRNIAFAGQARALSWQVVDADGNRQGLTISEFGEVGGPGFGGCPTGPETMAPNAPANVTATAGNGSLTATWSRATVMPDASAITGYRVTAVNPSGVQTSVNAPLCTSACSATVPNLTNGQTYTVQVRALNAAGASAPGTAPSAVSPVGGAIQSPTDVTAAPGDIDPIISASVSWTAPVQPAGVTVDGWRITAYNETGTRIKRVFMDEPVDATSAARSRSVNFATAGNVVFRVQAISADDAGTLSGLSLPSNPAMAQ